MSYQLPQRVFLESDRNNVHPGLPQERVFGILAAEPNALVFRPLDYRMFRDNYSSNLPPHPHYGPLVIPWGHMNNATSDVDHAKGFVGATGKLLPLGSFTKESYIFISYYDLTWEMGGVVAFSLAMSRVIFNKKAAADDIVRDIWFRRGQGTQRNKAKYTIRDNG